MQKNNNLIQSLRSFILIPILATSFSSSIVNPVASPLAVNQVKQYIVPVNPEAHKQAQMEEQAKKIDAYFRDRGMPLAGHGMKLVIEADKNGLDWTVVAAIAVRESTGGKFACRNPKAPNNAFGYGSCKFGFESVDVAIEKVARTLAGNSQATAHHYDGDLRENLDTYNGHAVASYADDVFGIMEKMKSYEV